VPDRAVRAAHGRGEPGPGRQLARRGEPADVADLGQQDQRGERADPGQLGQDLDPRVRPGVAADLGVEPVDDRLQGVDERQGVGDHLRRDGGQVQGGEPGPARPAPAARRPAVAMVGQDRVDPVAQQRPQPHHLRPVPQQRAELAHLRRRDPRLGQQVSAQQLRQDRGVDLVVLQPRRGDGLALQRVHQVRLEAVVLQQLYQPPPAERGLERRLGACWQAADHRQDRLHAVRNVAVGEHRAILVDNRYLGALAVDVDSDVDRHCRSPFRARTSPGASLCRAEQERGPAWGPVLIGSGHDLGSVWFEPHAA
jgi:hypothetical protein